MGWKLTLLTVLAAVLGGQFAHAATVISTDAGNGADSFVNISSLSENASGMSRSIAVKHNSNRDNHRIVYLRFDVSAAPSSVLEATLELTFLQSSDFNALTPKQYVVYGLEDGHPGEQWDEATLTWNNAPARSDIWPAPVVNPVGASVLGFFVIDNAVAQEGDRFRFSSDELLSFLSSDTNGLVTFVLARTTKDYGVEVFASKEHDAYPAPALVLTTPVPLPPAAVLLTIPVLFGFHMGMRPEGKRFLRSYGQKRSFPGGRSIRFAFQRTVCQAKKTIWSQAWHAVLIAVAGASRARPEILRTAFPGQWGFPCHRDRIGRQK